MANKDLSEKQKIFCEEYLIDLNATQAAIRAGYAEKYAHTNAPKLLNNPKIQEYISERMNARKSKLIADQDEVLEYLTKVLRGETQSEVVVVEGQGEGYSTARNFQKAPDEKERLKAAELLGKRYGTFVEKVEADVDTELTINIKRV